MANSNLKRFMRPELKTEEVFDVKIKDKDGKDMPLKMKRLSQKRIDDLRDAYTKREPAYDKNGNPMIQNGRLVMVEDRDTERFSRHMIVESLVDPKLDDPELMDYFDVIDKVDMFSTVFTQNEQSQILELFQNISTYKDVENVTSEEIEEAKN